VGILDGILKVGGLLLGGWQTASNAHNQREANRTNVKLQREQQAWEAGMSNTAVQRRADDIEAAGGNRALAFTNGTEASTPTVAPAQVRPVENRIDGLTTAMQLALMRAQVKSTEADARIKNVEADIREKLKGQEEGMRHNRLVEQYEWDDLKTMIMRSTASSSATEAHRIRETVDAMIQRARQDARTGQLNLEALENIAKVGGIEAGKMKDIIKLILDLVSK